ncbi:unnamed protein product, partial [Ectocarpus sp. 4 AP-2014]
MGGLRNTAQWEILIKGLPGIVQLVLNGDDERKSSAPTRHCRLFIACPFCPTPSRHHHPQAINFVTHTYTHDDLARRASCTDGAATCKLGDRGRPCQGRDQLQHSLHVSFGPDKNFRAKNAAG